MEKSKNRIAQVEDMLEVEKHGAQSFTIKASIVLPTREWLLPWQKTHLQYTATGYGSKIPSHFQVKLGGYWYRVYCSIYSNSGYCYILPRGVEVGIMDCNLEEIL